MVVLRTERFKKDFRRLPLEVQDRLGKTLELLAADWRHPSLRVKKMEGAAGIREFRVTANYRVTFQLAGEEILLRRVGTHDVLRQP